MGARGLLAVIWLALVGTLAIPAVGAPTNGGDSGALAPAAADPPITVDAPDWTFFSWFVMTVDELPTSNLEGPFTFTAPTVVVLKVTDGACRGDRFEVFDSGVSIGKTSSVPVDVGCNTVPDLDSPEAFLDPSYSHGTFPLGPGPHSLTIDTIAPSLFSGGAGLRVDSLSIGDCTNGGWRRFGTEFENQAACASFVEHQARQECLFIRAAHGRPAFRAWYGTPLTHRHAMRRCVRQRSDA